MTASDSVRQQRRTTGLSVVLLAFATVALGIAFSAVGEEILTLPESRKEAAEIAARLPGLRTERDSLLEEIAAQKAELSNQRSKVEEAQRITGRLPERQAEETRARDERDRLGKEVAALTADRDTLQGTVDRLAGRRKTIENELDELASRAEAERKRLDEVRQAVNEERTTLTQTGDEHAAESQKLAQVKTNLANTDRLLDSKRAELKGLAAEEQDLRRSGRATEGRKGETRDRKRT